ncbi:E3 ubiquitin-protein ligase RNF180 isoform 2-T2 [Mantella aurantiaca]
MSHKADGFLLRCWKCRKCIANSDCLIWDGECTHCQKGVHSSIYQGACNIWHVEAEKSPPWIKGEIEKVHWTAGKLNCPYCRSRIGAFNFFNRTKCTCGHPVIVRLCKSKIDVGFSVAEPNLVPSPLPVFTREKNCSNKNRCGMMEPFRRKWDQTFCTVDQYKPPSGLLMEALCLEVPAPNKYIRQAFIKTTHLKESNSVSRESRRACSEYSFHRKSRSLDLTFKKMPKPNGNVMILQMNQRPSEVSTLSSSSADQPSFSNRPLARLTEFSGNMSTVQNDLFLTRITYEESSTTTLSTSISNVPPREFFQSTAESTSAQVLQAAPTRSAGTNQRLTKRDIKRLKHLRRKQRKREKWLFEHGQINISNLRSEDEDDEDIPEKESYTCAVCLDVYFNPYMCYPCRHVFCEPCLRTLARDNPSRTPCPLCRAIIAIAHFQTDLSKSSAALFPNEYLKRKKSFQRASCAKWPLPSCNRIFRVFGEDTWIV